MLLTAHRVAQTEVTKLTDEDAPDGPEFDAAVQAEIDATKALDVPSADDDAFYARAAYILEHADGDMHEEMVAIALLKNHLKRRARTQ